MFDVLIEDLNKADLTGAGREITISELALFAHNYEVVENSTKTAEINSPIFIVGSGRCGSSFLHKKIMERPDFQGITMREGMTLNKGDDFEVEHLIDKWNEASPEYKEVHPHQIDDPAEDWVLDASTWLSMWWLGHYSLPNYTDAAIMSDWTPSFEFIKKAAQYISQDETRRRIFKAPQHSLQLPALFNVFPDAWVINSIRDKDEVVKSLFKTVKAMRLQRNTHVNEQKIWDEVKLKAEFVPLMIQDAVDKKQIPGERIIDIQFTDLISDTESTIDYLLYRCGHQSDAE